jgi:hypothetical protein
MGNAHNMIMEAINGSSKIKSKWASNVPLIVSYQGLASTAEAFECFDPVFHVLSALCMHSAYSRRHDWGMQKKISENFSLENNLSQTVTECPLFADYEENFDEKNYG